MPTRNYVIEIPVYWTPDQAEAVVQFLCDIEQAVFDAYYDDLAPLNPPPPEPTKQGDHDLPF